MAIKAAPLTELLSNAVFQFSMRTSVVRYLVGLYEVEINLLAVITGCSWRNILYKFQKQFKMTTVL